MQRFRSGSPRHPGVSKSGERRTSAAGGFVEITHGTGGGGLEAQWRRHNACDTWEWLIPPKSLTYPRSPMAGGGSRHWRGRGWRAAGRRSYHEPGYGSRHRDALGNFLGFLVIVITSFKPSSDRHLPQLPSFFSEPVASSSHVETPYRA